jgi:thiamine biosynthesis lipoprotein
VTDVRVHTVAVMGTVVTITVVGLDRSGDEAERDAAIARAVGWFEHVESVCSRFDPDSELRRLCARVAEPVAASSLLFEAITFAIAVAAETDGAFDPTVGASLESLGFDRDHRTGRATPSGIPAATGARYTDVLLNPEQSTITLARPLVLDLGAVAKGLAIDLAARALAPFVNFAIDAGGDLYLAGRNGDDMPWSVGIRHPRDEGTVIETLRVSDTAVCTSGDYERWSDTTRGAHHIIDARAGVTATAAASVTVLAPSAMVADALATAAFVLGPAPGIALLERHGVDGVMLTPSLDRFATAGMRDA